MDPNPPSVLDFAGAGLESLIPARHLRNLIAAAQTVSREPAGAACDIAALTEQMARGEEAAFRRFYGLYFDRLLAYLLVVTASEDAAREALQLTLVRLARYAKRFESEPVFWSWLTVLARSAVADERRKTSRYWALLGRFLQQQQAESGPPVGEPVARLLELLEARLADLPEEDRDLIRRKYFNQESVRQIAADFAATEKSVESRLGRVRRKLKDLMLTQLKHER